ARPANRSPAHERARQLARGGQQQAFPRLHPVHVGLFRPLQPALHDASAGSAAGLRPQFGHLGRFRHLHGDRNRRSGADHPLVPRAVGAGPVRGDRAGGHGRVIRASDDHRPVAAHLPPAGDHHRAGLPAGGAEHDPVHRGDGDHQPVRHGTAPGGRRREADRNLLRLLLPGVELGGRRGELAGRCAARPRPAPSAAVVAVVGAAGGGAARRTGLRAAAPPRCAHQPIRGRREERSGGSAMTTHRGLSRRSLLAAVGGLAALPMLSSCGSATGSTARLRTAFPVSGARESLDPHTSSLFVDQARAKALFDTLVAYADDMSVVPRLAESWEADPTGTRWRVRLRTARFHDGSPVTAEDVLYSYRRIADPATASPARWQFTDIDFAASRARSERELELVLHRPNFEFPVAWGAPATEIVPAGTTDFSAPVGSGPFRFVSFSPGAPAVLRRFDDYWGGPAGIEELEFVPIN